MTADLVFKLAKSLREEHSQLAQELQPFCQQLAANLSTYVILPELKTYPPIMPAETYRNVWILAAKSANLLLNSKILWFAASQLATSSKALPRWPSLVVLPGRLPSWSALTSGEHTLTLARVAVLLRKPPKLVM